MRSPQEAWWYYLPPGSAIVARGARVHAVGRALEEVLDPRLRDATGMSAARGPRPARDVPRRGAGRARRARRGPRRCSRARRSASPASRAAASRRSRARAAAAAPRHEVTGEVLLDGEDVLTMKPGRLRAVRWTRWRSSSRARCTRSTRCSASGARSARRSSCTRGRDAASGGVTRRRAARAGRPAGAARARLSRTSSPAASASA